MDAYRKVSCRTDGHGRHLYSEHSTPDRGDALAIRSSNSCKLPTKFRLVSDRGIPRSDCSGVYRLRRYLYGSRIVLPKSDRSGGNSPDLGKREPLRSAVSEAVQPDLLSAVPVSGRCTDGFRD